MKYDCVVYVDSFYPFIWLCIYLFLVRGNKMPTRCNGWYLLQILLLAQHVSGTIMLIIRSSRVLYRWSLPVVFGALVFKLSVWCGAEGCVLFAACNCRFQPDSPRQRSHNLYESYQLPRVQLITPDDGHSRCPKHVEFRDKIKFWIIGASCWIFIRRLSRCTFSWT